VRCKQQDEKYTKRFIYFIVHENDDLSFSFLFVAKENLTDFPNRKVEDVSNEIPF
jgi:hypothetical protein